MGRWLNYCLLFLCFYAGLKGNYAFRNYSIEEGLSNNWVNCLLKDKHGYMWFGTRNGLNKFDGYTFTHYLNQSEDSTSISGNWINCMLEDQRGNLWIGTNHRGLNCYERRHDSFHTFPLSFKKNASIRSLCELQSGQIWIGGVNFGVMIYCPESESIIPFHLNDLFPAEFTVAAVCQDDENYIWIAGDDCYLYRYSEIDSTMERIAMPGLQALKPEAIKEKSLYIDTQQRLWIGSRGNGMWIYDDKQACWSHFTAGAGNRSVNHDAVMGFAEPDSQHVWIVTDNGGINIYDRKTETFFYLMADPSDIYALNSNGLWAILVDESRRIWLTSFDRGVQVLDPARQHFRHYYQQFQKDGTLSHNTVICFDESPDGRVYIGTDGGGLNVFDPESGVFTQPVLGPPGSAAASKYIIDVHFDRKKRLWIAGLNAGLSRLDLKTNSIKHFKTQTNQQHHLQTNGIWGIFEDRQGILWFATWGGGLLKYDDETGHFVQYLHLANEAASIAGNFIKIVLEDRQGRFWVGHEGQGVDILNRKTGEFYHFNHQPDQPGSLSNNIVNCIYESYSGDLWVSTGSGLNRLNPDGETFTVFKKKDGLPNDRVFDILEDNQNYLWLSTDWGLSRFDPESSNFMNFYQSDGLQSNQFSRTACLKSENGILYFGGIKGFTAFDPRDIVPPQCDAPVVLTDFQVLSVSSPMEEMQQTHISETKNLTLNYQQRGFFIAFAALEYTWPERVLYRYRLDGFDADWRLCDADNRNASYTNLSGGDYVFRVQAGCEDNQWGRETRLQIQIRPPFWATVWFRILAAAAVVLSGLFLYYIRVHDVKKRNETLENINEKLNWEINERHEAEALLSRSLEEKMVLLKEIHHRVKNNMQVISSLLSLQKDRIDNDELAAMFQESQNRVRSMALIHEKLYRSHDLAHIQFGDYTEQLVHDLIRSYHTQEPVIHFEVHAVDVALPVSLAVPCGLIVSELVSNAIKYAFPDADQADCMIKIEIQRDGKMILLNVADNGIGIDSSLDFKNVDSLGLYLVRILAEDQLSGSVAVYREAGTRFEIQFEGSPV